MFIWSVDGIRRLRGRCSRPFAGMSLLSVGRIILA